MLNKNLIPVHNLPTEFNPKFRLDLLEVGDCGPLQASPTHYDDPYRHVHPPPPRCELQAQVKLGDKLPAVIRLTENQELKVDNPPSLVRSNPSAVPLIAHPATAKSIDKVVNIIKGVWLRDNTYW
ncbi:unnamed protein product [Chondrus crispus]|uniref:Uncharacterized protein n=1 Tax=Chondrus crispus TaxID=2769 RepID=R7QRS1_CHOCR|nr:unnamed protein product [Chondrus crispus]CDF40201.1 unnamed protein product [Chondrus crispus]|eukprot:XP_005710495.1 unnamed protein product [Chondrus crispus]